MDPFSRLKLAVLTFRSDIADLLVRLLGRSTRREVAASVTGEPARLVDMCTGTGSALKEFAARFPKCAITTIDRDPELLRLVGLRLAGAGIRNVATVTADARDTPIPSGSVDVVSISFGLHENPRPDRERILAECLRILKGGGLLLVCEYREASGPIGRFLMRLFFLVFEPPWISEVLGEGLVGEVNGVGFNPVCVRCDLPATRLILAEKEV